jgi:hypothetical protein
MRGLSDIVTLDNYSGCCREYGFERHQSRYTGAAQRRQEVGFEPGWGFCKATVMKQEEGKEVEDKGKEESIMIDHGT